MISKISPVALFVFVLCAFSCIKTKTCKQNQVCDTSEIILGNQTNDTVFFGIGQNYFDDTLLPGKSKSIKAGAVDVTYNPKRNCEKKQTTWSTWSLSSNYGSWAFNVDHCVKKSTFEYDNGTSGNISLYNESED